jgi:ABC-type multidrug transport system permease subunit
LVLGKALASSVRGISQSIVIYACAALMGVHVSFQPERIALVVLFIVLASALFSTFSLIIACIVKTRERFMGIGQFLTMPIFFASNAIYPIALMPAWLQAVGPGQPAQLRGGRPAQPDAERRPQPVRIGRRSRGVGFRRVRGDGHRRAHIPAPHAIAG